MLEYELKSAAMKEGAIRAGIARRETFSDAPPSADMRYEKPWANAVVSFAVTPGTGWIEDYLGKITRMVLKRKMFDINHEVYRIGSIIEERLKAAGFKAHNIIPNGIYRPDHTFEKEVPDHDLKPPLSLRYMAVGAGVGKFGWSGNVMVPGVWSNAYLGGVLTDALLEPDPLLEENLCDDCRICANVCPVGFIHKKEKTSVMIGGREHVYNKKHGDLRCLIGCGGYTGLSENGKWSSWSTGRTTLPDDDLQLPDLFVRLRDDQANVEATRNLTFGSRGILDRPFENAKPTCNQCLIVCSGPMEHRRKLMDLLFSSGVVELDEQGHEVVIRPEDKSLHQGSLSG
ncbi:MAG: 4Fe-4S binding protein [Deltaproteobacteria bacterium]|nr:4Fe-4S binding protein [Deltaproteobacteria bacterium]